MLDPFTQRRMLKFIEEFRKRAGQLPTAANLADEGFDKAAVSASIRAGLIEEYYVTLTNGSIVKGYKIKAQI